MEMLGLVSGLKVTNSTTWKLWRRMSSIYNLKVWNSEHEEASGLLVTVEQQYYEAQFQNSKFKTQIKIQFLNFSQVLKQILNLPSLFQCLDFCISLLKFEHDFEEYNR